MSVHTEVFFFPLFSSFNMYEFMTEANDGLFLFPCPRIDLYTVGGRRAQRW